MTETAKLLSLLEETHKQILSGYVNGAGADLDVEQLGRHVVSWRESLSALQTLLGEDPVPDISPFVREETASWPDGTPVPVSMQSEEIRALRDNIRFPVWFRHYIPVPIQEMIIRYFNVKGGGWRSWTLSVVNVLEKFRYIRADRLGSPPDEMGRLWGTNDYREAMPPVKDIERTLFIYDQKSGEFLIKTWTVN